MLRALTIEFVLVSLFVLTVLELARPAWVTPEVGLALGAVFLLLVVRDVALTVHEDRVIQSVLEDLDEE